MPHFPRAFHNRGNVPGGSGGSAPRIPLNREQADFQAKILEGALVRNPDLKYNAANVLELAREQEKSNNFEIAAALYLSASRFPDKPSDLDTAAIIKRFRESGENAAADILSPGQTTSPAEKCALHESQADQKAAGAEALLKGNDLSSALKLFIEAHNLYGRAGRPAQRNEMLKRIASLQTLLEDFQAAKKSYELLIEYAKAKRENDIEFLTHLVLIDALVSAKTNNPSKTRADLGQARTQWPGITATPEYTKALKAWGDQEKRVDALRRTREALASAQAGNANEAAEHLHAAVALWSEINKTDDYDDALQEWKKLTELEKKKQAEAILCVQNALAAAQQNDADAAANLMTEAHKIWPGVTNTDEYKAVHAVWANLAKAPTT